MRAGIGVLAAVQPSREALLADPWLPEPLVAACRAKGILTRALGTGALQVSPALVIGDDEPRELAEGVTAPLDGVVASA